VEGRPAILVIFALTFLIALGTALASASFESEFGKGQLSTPHGVAVDPEGNIWVVDTANNLIKEFNPKGEAILQFGETGSGNGQFKEPTGIALGTSGNTIWITDTGNNRVEKFNSSGEYKTKFGEEGSGNGQFKRPTGIGTVSGKSVLWIADTGNDRVQKVSAAGSYQSQFGKQGTGEGQFEGPTGIAGDFDGNLSVVDSGNDRVEKFDSEGAYKEQFGEKGSGEGQFEGPTWIANPSPWNLIVVDTGNNRVETWSQPPNPPATITEAPSAYCSGEATLHGIVNPEGAIGEYHFEYGTTTAYGTNVPSPDESIGSGIEDVAVKGRSKASKLASRITTASPRRTPGAPLRARTNTSKSEEPAAKKRLLANSTDHRESEPPQKKATGSSIPKTADCNSLALKGNSWRPSEKGALATNSSENRSVYLQAKTAASSSSIPATIESSGIARRAASKRNSEKRAPETDSSTNQLTSPSVLPGTGSPTLAMTGSRSSRRRTNIYPNSAKLALATGSSKNRLG